MASKYAYKKLSNLGYEKGDSEQAGFLNRVVCKLPSKGTWRLRSRGMAWRLCVLLLPPLPFMAARMPPRTLNTRVSSPTGHHGGSAPLFLFWYWRTLFSCCFSCFRSHRTLQIQARFSFLPACD